MLPPAFDLEEGGGLIGNEIEMTPPPKKNSGMKKLSNYYYYYHYLEKLYEKN